MLNRIILVGRLTKDPELYETTNGSSVATFDLAVDNTTKEADGTRGTCFLTCKAFGDKADNIDAYTKKGSKVAVDGSINQRNFIRTDGSKGHVIEVIIDSIEFLDPKPVNQPDEIQEAELAEVGMAKPQEEPKFDPYTGKPLKAEKPLKPKAKK